MSVDDQTLFERKSVEEHVEEVTRLLEDIEQIPEDAPNIGYNIEISKTRPYQEGNKWKTQTSMTRGFAPLETDGELTLPEQHALGSQRLNEKHGIDATQVANITMDGIGELSSIIAEYEVNIDFEKNKGLQYELKRENINARDPDNQIDVQEDLNYLETQMQTIINRYNDPEFQQESPTGWNYGDTILKSLEE